MSSSFRFDEPQRFTAGVVGEPGARTFFLQVAEAGQVVSLKCEKQQVAALAEYLATLLADLPTVESTVPAAELELVTPVLAEWTAGSMGVAYDEDDQRFMVVVDELVVEDELVADDEDDSPGVARFRLTAAQVAAFVPHAEQLVGGGRPACPLCGRPMNPDGHVCPRSNGHGRPA